MNCFLLKILNLLLRYLLCLSTKEMGRKGDNIIQKAKDLTKLFLEELIWSFMTYEINMKNY